MNKVYLFGPVSERVFDLCKSLQIDYFDPRECRGEFLTYDEFITTQEEEEKCNIHLYVIPPCLYLYTDIFECYCTMINESHSKGKIVICALDEHDVSGLSTSNVNEPNSLNYISNIIKHNDVKYFDNIEDSVKCINEYVDK